MGAHLSQPYSPRLGATLLDLDLGLGHAPRNTTRDQIAAALEQVSGVIKAFPATQNSGVWCLRIAETPFSKTQRAELLRIAQEIAARG